ncbi:hypothetical protein CIG75_14440 [Tumebacillus algifaecis]|uniref:Uncharacterized protein n=1 Tax=Tumebacillus algifaecis TaxID=1214604 RepID=A0A223D395_9BACL|nr:hypothetical protein [Tumebacillus algifaecis]ASS76040.1 hypothetical protein CIG75_14440 [Tumebacillus algifaecis]
MPIGGINIFAFKVNMIDKGYVNIGPLLVADWNGLSKQNFGTGEANGDGNAMFTGATLVQDSDAVELPLSRQSLV